MTSEDMKRVKFDTIVRDLDDYFGKVRDVDLNPLEVFFRDSSNEYVKSLLKRSFKHRCMCWDEKIILYNNPRAVKTLIEGCRHCTAKCAAGRCNIRYHLVFWQLLAVSMDEEMYNKKLSIIADTAYLVGFTNDMLADWIHAVKLVLDDQNVYGQEYRTREGREFFNKETAK